jgi:hypothetical protein
MRAGQNDGPLPFEASFEFGKGYVIRKSWNILLDEEIILLEEIIFLGKENREGGANNLFFQSRGTSIHSKGNGQIDGRATFGWVSVARDRRREQAKLQPTATLRFRAERLSAGLGNIRRPSIQSRGTSNHSNENDQIGGRATFGWVSVARDRRREQAKLQPTAALRFRAEGLSAGLEKIRRPSVASSTAANVATSAPRVIMMDEFEMRDEVKPAPASRLRAEGLWAGEAQVETERDEVTLPAEELRTATTL